MQPESSGDSCSEKFYTPITPDAFLSPSQQRHKHSRCVSFTFLYWSCQTKISPPIDLDVMARLCACCHFVTECFSLSGRVKRKNARKAAGGGGDDDED